MVLAGLNYTFVLEFLQAFRIMGRLPTRQSFLGKRILKQREGRIGLLVYFVGVAQQQCRASGYFAPKWSHKEKAPAEIFSRSMAGDFEILWWIAVEKWWLLC